MSIAIFGGNGFLGRKLCEYGIKNGFKVTSFSKSGKPPLVANAWLEKVDWQSADIFEESSYKSKLAEFDTVFHSIGKLLEDTSYKSNLNSRSLNLGVIKNLVLGSNPMRKTIHNSYDGLNKDSALKLVSAYSKANKKGHFVYISADTALPFIPKDYIRSKREAEQELLNSDFQTHIIRPGIMYDKDEINNRYYFVNGLKKGHGLKQFITNDQYSCVNKIIRPILSTDEVSSAIFKTIQKEKPVVLLQDLVNQK